MCSIIYFLAVGLTALTLVMEIKVLIDLYREPYLLLVFSVIC